MMRTIEIILVIIIITGAFIIAALFAILPSPRQVSPMNLRRLSLTTLQTLDVDFDLSNAVFKPSDDPEWSELQVALSACLPVNLVYNLTVYEVSNNGTLLYNPIKSISNAASLGVSSDASSYLVASSNVTFSVTPEKVGQSSGGGTLYILNCSDANGWWITGYTSQSLAKDLYNLLSPYFQSTVMVQNTTQLGEILNGTSLHGETLQNAVVINTFGEAVPIPAGYYASSTVGYDSTHSSYARYCYTLGKRVLQYNWTWASIVGYPLYYVSNTGLFPTYQNGWGIYGMRMVDAAGLNAFLRGLDNQTYSYDDTWITAELSGVVYLSTQAKYYCNYYGVYPSPYQTATRALPSSITSTYHLNATTYIFNQVGNYNPGAVYRHIVTESGKTKFKGALLALGVTRVPDIRLTALGILCDYKPRLYRSEYTATGTSRLVVLQLGEAGGI
ncbi:MAG TPA: hypothetical protein VMT26_02730 [Candidatus Bathyarchaeia archaeon]|jgi:hypothetical protein|nr:hypothetical protein [Candidatus Bathyarchaeia archaeon]